MDLIVGEAIHIYCKVRRSSSMLFISWIKETTHGFWNFVFEVRLQLANSILVVINEIHFLSCFMHRCSSQPQKNTAAWTPSGEAITTSFIFFATIPGVPIARAKNLGTQPFTLMSSSGQNASSHCQGFCSHRQYWLCLFLWDCGTINWLFLSDALIAWLVERCIHGVLHWLLNLFC